MQLRPKQLIAKQDIYHAWDSGARNVLLVYGCGGGKTVINSNIIKEHDGPSCAIAHRQELVSQMSITLARNEIRHRIVGPKSVVKFVVNHHMIELGRSYYDPNAHCGVAGVDTLVRRGNELSRWLKSCTLRIQDEGHHTLRSNKWGKATTMLPNAKGLDVTATPERADGKGLGRHADGIIDRMVEGPQARELINTGYLTDYRVFNPGVNFNRKNIPIGNSGDFTQAGATQAVKESIIIGDIPEHYLRIAPGKLNIVFVPSIDIAISTAKEFNARGVPAAALHSGTPLLERINIQRKFQNREILVLVNVDLFGEGYDLPALEVVQMARPTKSYPWFHQAFMRALRLMISDILSNVWDTYTDAQRLKFISESIKPHAIIIDHVNNIDTMKGGFGLPDRPRIWTLDRREKRSKNQKDDVIPTRTCIECGFVYERIYKKCPTCGDIPIYEPGSRSSPEFVDGDLTELDASTLARMRGEVDRVNMSPEDYRQELKDKYVPYIGVLAGVKRHTQTQEIQQALRMSMTWWAGYQRSFNRPNDEIDRRFYFEFGIDKLSAQALKTKDAYDLANRINIKLGEMVK